MQRLKYSITLFILASVFGSCEKQTSSPSFDDQPVIEGYLQANNIALITINRQTAASDNVQYAVDNIDSLTLFITCDRVVYPLKSLGNGQYCDSTLIIQEGKTYELRFMYNNKEVLATTTIPALPLEYTQSDTTISVQKIDSNFRPIPGSGFSMPDPVALDWKNTGNSYYMIVVKNIELSPELIRDTTNARFRVTTFRNEPSISNEYDINSMQLQYFGTHQLILYHLNPDYAALYNNNNNSSQNLTNPTTNIVNGLGIFTGLSADTLVLEVKKE